MLTAEERRARATSSRGRKRGPTISRNDPLEELVRRMVGSLLRSDCRGEFFFSSCLVKLARESFGHELPEVRDRAGDGHPLCGSRLLPGVKNSDLPPESPPALDGMRGRRYSEACPAGTPIRSRQGARNPGIDHIP